LLLVHELLERLSRISARAARAAELHIFGGMSFDEIADALGTSTRTAKRDWSMACAWWRSELSKSQ
jgi:RNA polymerase sigma-70 factor (ECF subfamily)